MQVNGNMSARLHWFPLQLPVAGLSDARQHRDVKPNPGINNCRPEVIAVTAVRIYSNSASAKRSVALTQSLKPARRMSDAVNVNRSIDG